MTVKKLGLALMILVGMTAGVTAAPNGFEASPAFDHTYQGQLDGHYTHQDGTPRFHWGGEVLAIDPAQPGENSAEGAAVEEAGEDSYIYFGN